MKVIIAVLFVICSFSTILAQVPKSRIELLRNDFAIFRTNFNENYPSLYRYANKEDMNLLLDSCYASINQNTTNLKYYTMLKFILSSIKDGHLYCSMPPDVASYIENKAKFFPFGIRFIHNRAFILNSVENTVPAGSEIISINGLQLEAIKTELLKYIVSDGNIQTKKNDILNHGFYFYYYLVFGDTDTFDVRFKLKNGLIRDELIKPLPEKDFIKKGNTIESKDLLQFGNRTNNIAVITIKTFDQSRLEEAHEDFGQFLESSFRKIHHQEISKLIIDLRGNGGGRDLYGSLLYSYLTSKPFHYYKRLVTSTRNLPYDQFSKKNSSFNGLNDGMLIDRGGNKFQLIKEAHSNLQTILPNKFNYKGKVWFLIDGASFSTTAEFCAVARSNKRGEFIGEETGGTYCGNTSGVTKTITLPNTEINISCGLVRYEMDVQPAKTNDRGIIPEYKVLPTIDDIITHRDAQMFFALKLINNNLKKRTED